MVVSAIYRVNKSRHQVRKQGGVVYFTSVNEHITYRPAPIPADYACNLPALRPLEYHGAQESVDGIVHLEAR